MKQRILALLAVLCLLPGLAHAKIFLVDTDDTLRVVTASGVSTIHMYAAWADLTTTALTPGASDAQVTTATTTVLVAAPGASTQRQIKGLSIRNAHASSSNVITVQFFDGATATELIAYTLLAGETLQWGEDENFRVIDASGQVKGQVTANAGTNLNTSSLLTTTAHDAAFGTAGTADSQVRTVQGIASMTPLQVQSNSANLATAALQDGIIKDGTGDTTQANVSGGRLQVENYNPNLAADNSTLSTSKAPVLPCTANASDPSWTEGRQVPCSTNLAGAQRVVGTVTVGTFPDNEPFNIAQINGVTPLMGAGNTGTGSPRVTIATDQAALTGMGVYVEDAAETAGGNLSMAGSVRRDTATSSAGATGDNATINTDAAGLLWTRRLDPCSGVAKTHIPINISTATTTELTAALAGASNHYYVCSIDIVTAGANNVALADDDTDNCASVTSGLAGGTTAASGWNFAANGGLTKGNGDSMVFKTGGTNRVLCLVTSAATQLSGSIQVVAAP